MSFIKSLGQTYQGRGEIWQLKCDSCNKKFIRPSSHLKSKRYPIKKMRHYCSVKCKNTHQATVKQECKTKNCKGKVSILSYSRDSKHCSKCLKSRSRKTMLKHNRKKLFELLGNKCIGCGETDPIFFQVDHINNDASTDVVKCSVRLRDYLAEPHRFQLLCANCNHAKRMNNGVLYRKCG